MPNVNPEDPLFGINVTDTHSIAADRERDEEDTWSFEKAACEVYNVLNTEFLSLSSFGQFFPRQPVFRGRETFGLKPKLSIESFLPHSPVVSDTLVLLQEQCADLSA